MYKYNDQAAWNDSIDEFQISENMGKNFRTFGDRVEYSGSSDFVRQVISKSSRLDLWIHQAAVKNKVARHV